MKLQYIQVNNVHIMDPAGIKLPQVILFIPSFPMILINKKKTIFGVSSETIFMFSIYSNSKFAYFVIF